MNSPYHQAWCSAGNKSVMQQLGDIRAYLSDGLWIWPCGATVDEKADDSLRDFHDTSKCDVCALAATEVLNE